MGMPEATIKQNDCIVLWEGYIGLSGQILIVQTIAKAIRKEFFLINTSGFVSFALIRDIMRLRVETFTMSATLNYRLF